MFVRVMAPIDGEGGDGGGAGGGEPSAPTTPSFDQAMGNVGAEAAAQLAAVEGGTPPVDPAAPPGGVSPPAPAAAAPQFFTIEQARGMAALYQQQQQQIAWMQQMMAQGLAPRQPAAPAPAAPERPTTMALLQTFREPQRVAGETDAQFEQKRTAALMDHMLHGNAKFVEDRAQQLAEQAVQKYQQTQEAQRQQQEGERQFAAALDDAVKTSGFAPGTPAAQYAREVAEARLVQRATRGETRGWTDAHWKQAMTQEVARAKSFMIQQAVAAGTSTAAVAAAATAKPGAPAAKPAAPAAPPIAGAGNVAPTTPPSGGPAKARTFEEAMQQVHGRALREQGQA